MSSSETSADFKQTTRHYIQGRTLHLQFMFYSQRYFTTQNLVNISFVGVLQIPQDNQILYQVQQNPMLKNSDSPRQSQIKAMYSDSKLLLGFPWPIIFKLETTK
jgi:hypothetical protein